MSTADRATRRAAESTARQQVTSRVSASPYEHLVGAFMDTIAEQLLAALAGPDFPAALRRRGYAIVPVVGAAVPDPPDEWIHDCLDLMGGEGALVDPLERVTALWGAAWRAGRHAARPDTEEDDHG
ncbi:hypothetical protein ACFFMN_23555 [Planobispora siamensis]|nr:hypothetical protein [Planobispora siamensis]